MKIYTRTGDSGETSLFGGGRVSKHHHRVDTYGTVDELNAGVGLARAILTRTRPARAKGNAMNALIIDEGYKSLDGSLQQIQNQLFQLGSDLATPYETSADWVVRMDAAPVDWLEAQIDMMTTQLEPLSHFVLPGGSEASAQLHVARTVCRRAERLAVQLAEEERINELAIRYLNRLSDYLFTAARYANHISRVADVRWESGRG